MSAADGRLGCLLLLDDWDVCCCWTTGMSAIDGRLGGLLVNGMLRDVFLLTDMVVGVFIMYVVPRLRAWSSLGAGTQPPTRIRRGKSLRRNLLNTMTTPRKYHESAL